MPSAPTEPEQAAGPLRRSVLRQRPRQRPQQAAMAGYWGREGPETLWAGLVAAAWCFRPPNAQEVFASSESVSVIEIRRLMFVGEISSMQDISKIV